MLGKPIAGGVPASVWGMSDDVADALLRAYNDAKEPGYSGMGTTLSANPLQFAAMRATLEQVMTAGELRAHGTPGAAAGAGLAASIARARPALACRARRRARRVHLRARPLRNGGEAEAAHAPALEAAHPCRAGQSRLPDRAVPQHDAGLAGDHGSARSTA